MRFALGTFFLTSIVLAAGTSACSSVDGPSTIPNATEPPPEEQVPGDPGRKDPKPDPGEEPVGPGGIIADLRADTNRDGEIKFDGAGDNEGEDVWDKTHGAVFLANIDDDEIACPKQNVSDLDLPKCNDAADVELNGADDANDLARLKTKPWADAPASAKATITLTNAERVHVFKVKGSTFTLLESGDGLTAAEVKDGIELAIEGRDIVRDAAAWDGYVEITWKVDADGNTASDKVKMRVAPLLTYHHLLPAEKVWASTFNSAGNAAMRGDLNEALTAAGLPSVTGIPTDDPWNQDYFETGFMSMPAPGGGQHAIRVNIRSANVYNPNSATNPLRAAGRSVFTLMRGKDTAAVQEFDRTHSGDMDSLNSFGNFETIPPYSNGAESFPLGRVLRGSTSRFYPDPKFQKMIDAQKIQPTVQVDTSWLSVGHVDETISFVKASTPRGWKMLVNDAAMARSMLETLSDQGYGDVPMFVGKYWIDNRSQYPADATIDEVLSDTDVMGASAEAATEVNAQVAIIKAATGLTDSEIIKIPFLHMPTGGGSVAYQPGTVNGIYIADGHFVAPEPHGPIINGNDPFKKAMSDALTPLGVTVHFAEDWDTYHRNMGEVHCGTNTTRRVPDVKWWESGR